MSYLPDYTTINGTVYDAVARYHGGQIVWYFSQSSGQLFHENEYVGTGYSGHNEGLNNPADQAIPEVGPTPQGAYRIGPAFDDPRGTGPLSMKLFPADGTDDFGRSGFRIHGDNPLNNRSASHGCIVLAREIREQIATSEDRNLTVTP